MCTYGRAPNFWQPCLWFTTTAAHDDTHISIKKIFPYGDVSCAALPVSDFLFQYSRNTQGTSDRLQIGFVFDNTTFEYIASTLEIHKFQDKYKTLRIGNYTVNCAVYLNDRHWTNCFSNSKKKSETFNMETSEIHHNECIMMFLSVNEATLCSFDNRV